MLLCVLVPGFSAVHGSEQWEDILDGFDVLTPLVDDAGPGRVYLEMRGITGNPRSWHESVHATLDGVGLPVRTGVAINKFSALAAAWISDGTVCEEGMESAMLAPLPLQLLDLDPITHERLRLLAIHTLGDLARLPHGPFVRRFGMQAGIWHDRARGIDPTPFLPRGHTLAIEAALFGEGSAEAEAQVIFALRILLERVTEDLARLGKRAALLQIVFELENGDVQIREVGLARATSEARPMLDVVRANLEGAIFPAPIVGLRIRALRLEDGGESVSLFAGGPDPGAVAVALGRLKAIGEPARQARTVRAYPLEEQFAYGPFEVQRTGVMPPEASTLPAYAVPQLRLLSVREIDVSLAAGAPVSIGTQAVIECVGPWRIEENWFDTPISRDEYDVLLEDGVLYRVYRQGERWYVRGAYD